MKKNIGIIICIGLFVCLVMYSSAAAHSCRYALSLCAQLIIPSLFPFFILSIMLNRAGLPYFLSRLLSPLGRKLFGVSGAGTTAFFVGLTGGYPMGCAYIADMYKSGVISRTEAEKLLGFCNNSGPAFIVGALGSGVFSSVKYGLLLYTIHILSAATVGIMFSRKSPIGILSNNDVPVTCESQSFVKIFTSSLSQAVASTLSVCGFILCFTVIIGLLDSFGIIAMISTNVSALTGLPIGWMRSLICGFIELGCGIGAMKALLPTPSALILSAFLLGWGGISVQLQSFAILSDSKLKGTLHITGHLLSAGLASLYAYVLFVLIRI